jgi:hypothetical protein
VEFWRTTGPFRTHINLSADLQGQCGLHFASAHILHAVGPTCARSSSHSFYFRLWFDGGSDSEGDAATVREVTIYSDVGRPSIAPERLLRSLPLQIFYSVRSERMLMEQLQYNLLFRCFVGMEMMSAT